MQYWRLAHIFIGEIKNDIECGILAAHSIKINFYYFKVVFTQIK